MDCAFKSFLKARVETNIIKATSEINGRNSVPDDIRSHIITLIEDTRLSIKKPLAKPATTMKQSVICNEPAKSRVSSLNPSGMASLKIMFTNADQLTSSKLIELKAPRYCHMRGKRKECRPSM